MTYLVCAAVPFFEIVVRGPLDIFSTCGKNTQTDAVLLNFCYNLEYPYKVSHHYFSTENGDVF